MQRSRRQFIKGAAALAAATQMPQMPQLRSMAAGVDRLAAFREAKFGMFIHWGPYSVAGVEASWPLIRPTSEITEAEYVALPQRFNPVRFDPHAWIALARAAGQRYMVFTTKHHDGFCMFDSAYTNYKITNTPYGKDITRMLADACHAESMPIGFYYSPPDMHHPAFRDTSKPVYTNYRGEPWRPEWPLYLDYMGLQLDELLLRYGPVAEVWFDSVDRKVQREYDGQRFIDQIRVRQPAAVVNNRLDVPGDFMTPEQFIPKGIPTRSVHIDSTDHSAADKMTVTVPRPEDFQPWETCMTINRTWAYRPKDRNFKSADELIRTLIEVISRGGNFLLDVGPQPDGLIQPEFVERLEAVGQWTHRNGPAIYDSTYGPLQGNPDYRTTARDGKVYVFVMNPSATEITLSSLPRPVRHLTRVGDSKPLPFKRAGEDTLIPIGKELWNEGIPVLELS